MKTKTYDTSQMEEAAKGARKIWCDSFDFIGESVIVTDPDGVILYANPGVERVSGFTREEVLGKTPGELWGRLMDQKFYERMWRTIKTNKKAFAERLMARRKDGSTYWSVVRIHPVINAAGNATNFIGFHSDIDERVREEKMHDDILSSIIHQIKSPLSAEHLLLELVDTHGDSEQREILKQARAANEKILDYIRDLLTISRLKRDMLRSESDKQTIGEVVKRTFNEHRTLVQSKRLRLSATGSLSSRIPYPYLAGLIFTNLISNAIKYSSSGGCVVVRASKKGKELTVSIKDSGIGIPEADQPKIFSPLFRTSVSKKVTEGTGLGLYISKSIADNLGFRIWFESAEKQGTKFFVAIPLKEK